MTAENVRECIWQRSCLEEDCSIDGINGVIKGVVPDWLQGSLYRVGPGINGYGQDKYLHAIDCGAVVHVFHIDKGQVQYRSRALNTKSLRTNKAANRIAVTEFGTIATPDPCQTILGRFMARFVDTTPKLDDVTDNCNVTVFFLGDEVYTGTETSTIHRIDPVSLATLDGDGTKCYADLMVTHVSAHAHTDRDNNTFSLASSLQGSDTFYNVIKMPKTDEEKCQIVASIKARSKWHISYYHSFGITDNYIIFLETPMTLNVIRLLLAKPMNTSMEQCFDYDPKGQGRFTIVDKRTGQIHPITYITDAFACFHHINAYEQDDQLVVDLCSTDGNVARSLYLDALAKGTSKVPKCWPVRFVLPLMFELGSSKSPNLVILEQSMCEARLVGKNVGHVKQEVISGRNSDLPNINYGFNGRKYRYFYTVGLGEGAANFLSLHKTDVESKEEVGKFVEEDVQVSEPVFVARPGAQDEDDGCVLSLIFKDNKPNYAGLLVLDGKTFREMARVDFQAKGIVTQTFHGIFGNKIGTELRSEQ